MTDLILQKDENLIDSNPRDKALLKIMELQKDPAAIKTKYYSSIYQKAFIHLAGSFFNINPGLIKANFDRETIRGLEELIIQKAKKWSFITQFFMYGVPLAGWLFVSFIKHPVYYDDGSTDMATNFSYRFLLVRKKLKKNGVDPVSLLIKEWKIREKESS